MTEIIAIQMMILTCIQWDDGLHFLFLAIGGAGVVSVASHIIGNEMQEMVNSVFDRETLRKQQSFIKNCFQLWKVYSSSKSSTSKNSFTIKGIGCGICSTSACST